MAKRGKIGKKQERIEIDRPVKWRKYRYFFLIVCEDQNTERVYFEQFEKYFPPGTVFLKVVGTGLSPKGVVERTQAESELIKLYSNKEIDKKWAVFDKDDADLNQKTIENFHNAFEIARSNNIQLAWSNEVFELWLLLHFQDVDHATTLPREEVYEKLSHAARKHPAWSEFVYRHGHAEIIDCVMKTGNEERAISRAEKLDEYHAKRPVLEANPCTKVYQLVRDLRVLIDWYALEPAA
ncbi:MAG: RloB family protein [Bacteroidia bacterium]|nr:RloB family protein [Bacteroidia bacterium]